jgi:hypothetical protein
MPDYLDANYAPYGDSSSTETTLQQPLNTGNFPHKFGVWVGQIVYNVCDFVYFHDGVGAGIYE